MISGLEPVELPADAVEVGRVQGAWGIKGWIKVQPYSASPEALFSCKRWFLLPPERGPKAAFDGPARLKIKEARQHADAAVASAHGLADRDAAEALKGARIFIPRSSFPTPEEGEYYWVDLIGLAVVNREGVALGEVADLMSTGAQQVLVVGYQQAGKPCERLIPFVDAYVDEVDLQARRIIVDWQADY
ncbi:MAG: ribosome maturation factor RimM [Desulfovibrionaceae bacterium]|jgi:16S rRNA processing protein RimM|nr:ribosome maturation factor RimM [Desulfovibrionaceae bacterium]